MQDNRRNGVCGQIDEDTIELHAMGRLSDSPVRQHLDTCEFCQERVAEQRSWIEDLKQALLEFQQTERTTRRDAGGASRLDES